MSARFLGLVMFLGGLLKKAARAVDDLRDPLTPPP
jgi:hypothetical protein